jgi:hypothetical protein
MLDAIQQQRLATLTAARATPSSSNSPTGAHDMVNLLTELMEESLLSTHGGPTAAWLDWRFAADAADSHSYEVDAQAAGTYQLVGQTNCAGINVEVDERAVTVPFTVRVGERLKLTIQRTTLGIAAVQFLRVGVYRQLVAC